jgi:hypothetical protein
MHRTLFNWPACRPAARKLVFAGAILAGLWAAPAQAMRPIEGTDAAVAEAGLFELELGPLGYVRHGSARSIVAPAVVGNWGLPGDFEVVIEGRLNRALGETTDMYRTSFGDTALSVKHVFRHGSLQDGGTGVSLAAECGVLLPEIHGEHGTGATCAGIASQRFDAGSLHLNAALTRNRDGSSGRFLGLIAEGSAAVVRPVMELFTERDNNGGRTNSALMGAIWQKSDDLSFDVGVRRARVDSVQLTELRLGLTWSYAMHK